MEVEQERQEAAEAVRRLATGRAAGNERKPVECKAGEAPNDSRDVPKACLPVLEEKKLGLGCAQD